MKSKDEAMREANEARARVEELVKKVGELKEELNQASASNDGLIDENRRLKSDKEDLQDNIAKLDEQLHDAKSDPVLKALVEVVDQRVAYWQKKVGNGPAEEATLDAGERVVKVKATTKDMEFTVEDIQGRLLKLAAEGHFDDWRRLGETRIALEGHNWTEPETTVRSGLEALYEKGLLSMKSDRKWGRLYAKPDLVRFVEAS